MRGICSRYAFIRITHSSPVFLYCISSVLTGMDTQRIKGAIDGAIERQVAEEQSRQRTAAANTRQPQSSGSGPARRERSSSGAKTQSPARRPRTKPTDDSAGTNSGGATGDPDPAFFESAFVLEDTDESPTPARIATPAPLPEKEKATTVSGPAMEKPTSAAASPGETADQLQNGDKVGTKEGLDRAQPPTAGAATGDAPAVLAAKLRRLANLEKKYPGEQQPMRVECAYRPSRH